WRISAQSSKLITFHNGRWPCFQMAEVVLFSVGVNIIARLARHETREVSNMLNISPMAAHNRELV
ncbi:hypothetical protein, partial [Pseudarthrobacter sp. MDT1-22]